MTLPEIACCLDGRKHQGPSDGRPLHSDEDMIAWARAVAALTPLQRLERALAEMEG
jgi:hypothetical protein